MYYLILHINRIKRSAVPALNKICTFLVDIFHRTKIHPVKSFTREISFLYYKRVNVRQIPIKFSREETFFHHKNKFDVNYNGGSRRHATKARHASISLLTRGLWCLHDHKTAAPIIFSCLKLNVKRLNISPTLFYPVDKPVRRRKNLEKWSIPVMKSTPVDPFSLSSHP